MRVTCTESNRVTSVSMVPMYETDNPRSRPIDVMLCFGVRYLKESHLAMFLRWPFKPRPKSNPACLLLNSAGLLYAIQDVSIPLARREMLRPAETPAWKNAHANFSSVYVDRSALTVLLRGFIVQRVVNPCRGYFSVTSGLLLSNWSIECPDGSANVRSMTHCMTLFCASKCSASVHEGSGMHSATAGRRGSSRRRASM